MSIQSAPLYSTIFCCGVCHDAVALVETPAGEQCYTCSNPVCGKAVHVNCPEALAVIADIPAKLRQRILETDKAGGDPFDDVVQLMKIDPVFDIGIAALIRTTMDIVQHSQRRTATIEAIRLAPMVA